MGKLRIGIIGCGSIARVKHVRALLQFPDRCEITALADMQPAAAYSLREDLLPGAKVYEDFEELLNDPSVDAVHICTPNHSHCEIAVKALNAGKHVMCEKPMAESYADACRMVEAAKKNQRKLTVGYQNRFRDDSQAVHAAARAGDLGEIYYAKAHATRRKKVPTWGRFLSMEAQGGGISAPTPSTSPCGLWITMRSRRSRPRRSRAWSTTRPATCGALGIPPNSRWRTRRSALSA